MSWKQVVAAGRFGTDRDGYQAMLAAGRAFAGRVWAVEGCNGIGWLAAWQRSYGQSLAALGLVVFVVQFFPEDDSWLGNRFIGRDR
jgi:hypothetical protein